MPKMTGGVKTGRFYISLPDAAAREIDEYIKDSGMYRACFLSYALAVGTRVVERQRMNDQEHRVVSLETEPLRPIQVTPADFQNDAHHEGVVTRQKQVDRALEKMTPEQRSLLELAYFEGLSQAQIATRLDLPIASIRARMIMALQHLDTLLSDNRPNDEGPFA